MHETKRRHSNERRIRNASPIAIAERAIAIAARGDYREAARVALLADRLLQIDPKLRSAKAKAEMDRFRAEASIAAALAAVETLNTPPPTPAPPPVKSPPPLYEYKDRPGDVLLSLRSRGLIP